MCLSTVYLNGKNGQTKVMGDVAHIEAEDTGYWLIDLFGERRFVEGRIHTVNLMDGCLVMLPPEEN